MASGDWPKDAYGVVGYGYLRQLAVGLASDATVDWTVVLPSGTRVVNPGNQQFHYSVTGSIPAGMTQLADAINYGGIKVLQALAIQEGIPVHLTTGIVAADGTYTPSPTPPPL